MSAEHRSARWQLTCAEAALNDCATFFREHFTPSMRIIMAVTIDSVE